MSVESDLKKDGIIVIKKLNTLKVNSISINISVILSTFKKSKCILIFL